jgi:hypothetical protein
VYLERVERGKRPSRLSPSYGERRSGSTAQTCQFQHPVFPFVRTSQVGLINFEPVLHNPHFFTRHRPACLTSPCRLPIEKSRPRCCVLAESDCGCCAMCMFI